MATKKCQRCGEDKSYAHYIAVNNSIMHGGSLPICRECLTKQLDEAAHAGNLWNVANKICQWADVPFIPEEFDKMFEGQRGEAIGPYIAVFRNKPYDTLNWQQYNDVYNQIKEENRITDALPEIREREIKEMEDKWGKSYEVEELEYLEQLHQGLINSQNIAGALNEDQALKLCKISLIIENKIRAGEDFSKDLKGYEALAKLANLTPKNVKNAEEFSSFGEAGAYLEKKGWKPDYYDGAARDEVDCVQKNIQLWNQMLYVNETGVAEEIEQRIQNLKIAAELQGSEFNEEELRKYMAEQEDKHMEEEEFRIDLE